MNCLLAINIDFPGIIAVIYDVVRTYWHSLMISALLVSCAMALSYLPSVISNKIRRDGSLPEKGVLYTLLWFPAAPIIGLRAGIKKFVSKLKRAGTKLEQYNSFNELLDWTTARRFLYLVSDYLPIGALSALYHFAMKYLSPDVFEKFQALTTSSDTEVAKFSISRLIDILKLIVLPTSTSGWILLAIIVWCSASYLGCMLFEPFKGEKGLSDTPHFCMFYAKKWSNQISSLALLLAVPQVFTDYTGIDTSFITDGFAIAEVYLIVFGVLSFIVCFIPIFFGFIIRKLLNPTTATRRYFPVKPKTLLRLSVTYVLWGVTLVLAYKFAPNELKTTWESIEATLNSFLSTGFLSASGYWWIPIVFLAGMAFSICSIRMSLIVTIGYSGLLIFVLRPSLKNCINEFYELGTIRYAMAPIVIITAFVLWLLFFNGLLGYCGTKANVREQTKTPVFNKLSVIAALRAAGLAYFPAWGIALILAILLSTLPVGNYSLVIDLCFYASVIAAIVMEYINHVNQNICTCDIKCPSHSYTANRQA